MPLKQIGWRKSSYSGQSGSCVEVAQVPGVVAVRDTKDREGAVLTFGRQQWAAFVSSLRNCDR